MVSPLNCRVGFLANDCSGARSGEATQTDRPSGIDQSLPRGAQADVRLDISAGPRLFAAGK